MPRYSIVYEETAYADSDEEALDRWVSTIEGTPLRPVSIEPWESDDAETP